MRKIMGFSVMLLIALTVVGAWAVATTPQQDASLSSDPRVSVLDLTMLATNLPLQQFDAI